MALDILCMPHLENDHRPNAFIVVFFFCRRNCLNTSLTMFSSARRFCGCVPVPTICRSCTAGPDRTSRRRGGKPIWCGRPGHGDVPLSNFFIRYFCCALVDLETLGQVDGKFYQPVIQMGRADFRAVGHGSTVHFEKQVIGEVVADVNREIFLHLLYPVLRSGSSRG